MNVFGVQMSPDVRAWSNEQRRVGSLLAIGAAALLVLVGLVTYAFAGPDATAVYWTLLALVVLVLAYEIAVVVLGLRAAPAAEAAPAAYADAAAPASAWQRPEGAYGEPEPPAGAAAPAFETLTLRCGDCGTVFDVQDTGQRPLYHNCPGCGAEGVMREPATPAAPRAEAAYAPPAREPLTPRPAAAPAPVTPRAVDEALTPRPAPAAVKRIKLRCGGCKQVFAIDDTGERPLRNRCAHCGRLGEIK